MYDLITFEEERKQSQFWSQRDREEEQKRGGKERKGEEKERREESSRGRSKTRAVVLALATERLAIRLL